MKDCVKVLQLIKLHSYLHIRHFENLNTVVLYLGPFKNSNVIHSVLLKVSALKL